MNVLNASKQFLTKNSTTILMGLGAVTAVSSVAMAIKETPKAITKMYEAAKEIDPDTPIESVLYPKTDLYDKIGWKETLKSTWKCYIPTVLLAGTSLTCFFAAMHITSGKVVALSSAVAASQQIAEKYQREVIDIIGKDKERDIRKKVNESNISETPVPSKSGLVVFGSGDTLVFDEVSGRYFLSDKESIRTAMNDFNQQVIWGSTQDLNDWYDVVGLEQITIGEYLGWNADRLMDISFDSMIAPNGEPCIVLNYLVQPSVNFKK